MVQPKAILVRVGMELLSYNKIKKELSEGFKLTTNNRMELLAVIIGLESIRETGYKIIIYSDSKYVVDAVNKTGFLIGKINYKKKNSDLWQRFLKVYRKHQVVFKWIKGHAAPSNERCDQLAVQLLLVKISKQTGL